MSPNFHEQLSKLPGYLHGHVVLSGVALAVGIAISLPLSLWVAHVRALREPVVAAAGVVQTVPSLALLALMVPLLGAFGFWPALCALVLYSMLPIVRNTVTGICGVDPELVEAARGLGMTPLQVVTRVELPLALPVIVAGVRTSAIWVVGLATLSTPVGQTSLGNYIFGGLQTRNWTAVLFGCIAAALLAIVLDGLLALLESGVRGGHRLRWAGALGGMSVLFAAGALAPAFASPRVPGVAVRTANPAAAPTVAALGVIRVGAKNFTEQYILAALLQRRLGAAGLPTQLTPDLGSSIAFDALSKNQLDVYIEYTGTLWANAMKKTETPPPWKVSKEVAGWLAQTRDVRLLGALGFENTYALAMRRDRAAALGIRSLEDLAARSGALKLGSDYEFFQRPEWRKLRETYGFAFAGRQSFDPTFMYQAVVKGQVDAITAFSTDGRIAAEDLVVLADTRHAFPPYDAVILLSPRVSGSEQVVEALKPLVGAVSAERMREANFMVDRERDKKTPAQAAAWLDAPAE